MSSLTNKLAAIGANQCIYLASLGRTPTVAGWSPEQPWNGSDTGETFFKRYHHYNQAIGGDLIPDHPELYSAGAMVEEGPISGAPEAWDSTVLKVLRDWIGDPSWVPTIQDKMDLKLVKDPGAMDAVFNTKIMPLIREATATGSGGTGAATTSGDHPTAGPGKVATVGGASTAATATTHSPEAAKALLTDLHQWVSKHGGRPMRHIQTEIEKALKLL